MAPGISLDHNTIQVRPFFYLTRLNKVQTMSVTFESVFLFSFFLPFVGTSDLLIPGGEMKTESGPPVQFLLFASFFSHFPVSSPRWLSPTLQLDACPVTTRRRFRSPLTC